MTPAAAPADAPGHSGSAGTGGNGQSGQDGRWRSCAVPGLDGPAQGTPGVFPEQIRPALATGCKDGLPQLRLNVRNGGASHLILLGGTAVKRRPDFYAAMESRALADVAYTPRTAAKYPGRWCVGLGYLSSGGLSSRSPSVRQV